MRAHARRGGFGPCNSPARARPVAADDWGGLPAASRCLVRRCKPTWVEMGPTAWGLPIQFPLPSAKRAPTKFSSPKRPVRRPPAMWMLHGTTLTTPGRGARACQDTAGPCRAGAARAGLARPETRQAPAARQHSQHSSDRVGVYIEQGSACQEQRRRVGERGCLGRQCALAVGRGHAGGGGRQRLAGWRWGRWYNRRRRACGCCELPRSCVQHASQTRRHLRDRRPREGVEGHISWAAVGV